MSDLNLTFDAAAYAETKRLFGNACRNADRLGDNFARSSMVALATSSLSPLALAITVYDEMKPKTAKGKDAEPKEADKAPCGVSVSSLRSANGGATAKVTLETIFYVWEHRSFDADAVASFIRGDAKAMKLHPLKAHIQKLRAEAAKAEAEANGGEAETEVEGQDEAPVTLSPIAQMAADIRKMDGEALQAAEADLADLLEAVRDAIELLAAADSVSQAA